MKDFVDLYIGPEIEIGIDVEPLAPVSREYIELLDQDEDKLYQTIIEVERNPLFHQLRETGIVTPGFIRTNFLSLDGGTSVSPRVLDKDPLAVSDENLDRASEVVGKFLMDSNIDRETYKKLHQLPETGLKNLFPNKTIKEIRDFKNAHRILRRAQKEFDEHKRRELDFDQAQVHFDLERGKDDAQVVARVWVVERQLYHQINDHNCRRYFIRPARLGNFLPQLRGSRRDVKELLAKLRGINHVGNLRRRVVKRLCVLQSEHIITGNPLSLRPISQKQIAEELGEEASSISRGVKDRKIEIFRGSTEERIALSLLCNHRIILPVLVKGLALKHPDESDKQLRSRLVEEYGVEIARRTVNHHRRTPLSLQLTSELPQLSYLQEGPQAPRRRGRRKQKKPGCR